MAVTQMQGLGLRSAPLRLLMSCFWLFSELWLLHLQQQWRRMRIGSVAGQLARG